MINKESYFLDYDAYTQNDIVSIDNSSITLSGERHISFSECESNYRKLFGAENDKYIGEAEDDKMSLFFFTTPKPIMIRYMDEGEKENYQKLKKSIEPYKFK